MAIEIYCRNYRIGLKESNNRGDKNNLLLFTDSEGRTAWHMTPYYGDLDVMQEIWE
jgi:hypothetical protein